jgi:ribosome-binding protein aMBF1 (putative translation factor)
MAADSDSRIAWHRVQVRKHRDTLTRVETSKFRGGETADRKAIEQRGKLVAELKQKIKLSEQVIAQHERQGRRPLATDLHSLSNVSWGNWAAYGSGQR